MTVNINNIGECSYEEFFQWLQALTSEQVPEGGRGEPTRLDRLDFLIGRLANTYATLQTFWGRVSYLASVTSATDTKNILRKKKETLYEVAKAIELQWQAASRMVTIQLGKDDQKHDRRDYEPKSRQERYKATDDEPETLPPHPDFPDFPGAPAPHPAFAGQDEASPAQRTGTGRRDPGPDDTPCPKCGSLMWDNRLSKRNPKAPDFKCRDRSCDGVIWPAREKSSSPPPTGGGKRPPMKSNTGGWDSIG